MAINKNPTVSVIIPTYNAGPYICQAVDSVLAQTYRDVECIVVDDGSNDDTEERLSEYGSSIRYIYQDNAERSAARNNGIRHAAGDLIAFLDADDYWEPNKLERQVDEFTHRPDLGLLYTQARLIKGEGELVRYWKGADTPWPEPGLEAFSRSALMQDLLIAGFSTTMVRRSCLDEAGGFDRGIIEAEDWSLTLALADSWQIDLVREVLVSYRVFGNYMPARLQGRNAQKAWVTIIEGAFADRPNTTSYQSLKSKALGQAYLLGAWVDFGTGDTERGAKRLLLSRHHAPELFYGNTPPFVERMAYFATYLYDTVTPLDESLAFVRLVFEHLPESMLSLSQLVGSAQQHVCAIHAFDSYERGDLRSTRAAAWGALTQGQKYSENRGLHSIFAESLLGTKLMGYLRGISHALAP